LGYGNSTYKKYHQVALIRKVDRPERREGHLYMIWVGDKYGWVREEVVLEMDAE